MAGTIPLELTRAGGEYDLPPSLCLRLTTLNVSSADVVGTPLPEINPQTLSMRVDRHSFRLIGTLRTCTCTFTPTSWILSKLTALMRVRTSEIAEVCGIGLRRMASEYSEREVKLLSI